MDPVSEEELIIERSRIILRKSNFPRRGNVYPFPRAYPAQGVSVREGGEATLPYLDVSDNFFY